MIGLGNNKRNSERGLTLIEALVATVIVGIGFVSVFQMVQYSVSSIGVSSDRSKANLLMTMVVEDFISEKLTVKAGLALYNAALNKGFKNSFMFRLGFMIPEKGINSRTRIYNFLYYMTKPIFPILKISKDITTTTKLGQAMINTMFTTSKLVYLSNKEINIIADEEHN